MSSHPIASWMATCSPQKSYVAGSRSTPGGAPLHTSALSRDVRRLLLRPRYHLYYRPRRAARRPRRVLPPRSPTTDHQAKVRPAGSASQRRLVTSRPSASEHRLIKRQRRRFLLPRCYHSAANQGARGKSVVSRDHRFSAGLVSFQLDLPKLLRYAHPVEGWHGEEAARYPVEGAAASAHAVGAADPAGEAARPEAAGAVAPAIPDRRGSARGGDWPGPGAAVRLVCDDGVPLGRPVQHERVCRVRAAVESTGPHPDRDRRAAPRAHGCGALEPPRARVAVLRLERAQARRVLPRARLDPAVLRRVGAAAVTRRGHAGPTHPHVEDIA